MDRKTLRCIILIVCVVLAFGSAVPIHASAATIEPYDGSISTTYITIFRDMIAKKPISDNYVFLRTGQNTYKMYVGKFTYENQVLTADGSCYVYILDVGSQYNSGYIFSQAREDDVVVNPGSSLIYSDLGPWPSLQESDQYWFYAIALLLMIILLYDVLRWVSEVR